MVKDCYYRFEGQDKSLVNINVVTFKGKVGNIYMAHDNNANCFSSIANFDIGTGKKNWDRSNLKQFGGTF